MPYYNNDDRPSGILKKTLIGVGVVAAVLGRKQLGKWGARAVETVSEALIHNKKGSAFTLTRNFDDIERVLSAKEFGVRTQYAEQRMKDALVSQRGWNAEAADKLFATTRSSNQWTKGVGFSADASVFSGRNYEGLLGSIGKDANTALSDIYAARSHAKVLTIKSGTAADLSKEGMGGLLNQLEITRNAVEQSFLKQMAENARAGTINGIARGEGGYAQAFNKALGLSHVSVGDISRSPKQLAFKLGDAGFQRLQATASSMEALGRKHGVDVSSFQFGELLRDESGIIHDTRGASRLVNRGLGWLEQHTQIPMIPFREGFSPASLFSWLKSKDPKFAANITRQGLQKQIGISDLAEDGLSAIRVGRELIGTKYGANVADSEVTRVFAGRFAALDATGGFGKRSLTSLYASRNMDFSGQTGIKGWFNFENQMERSQLDKILQVINRSKNPEGELHATEAFRRMLEAPGDLSERGVDAITSLIYNRGRLLTSTLDNAAIKDDALRAVFDNLEDDKALLKFFDEANVAGDYSPRLKDVIHEYQSTRGEFAHGYHPFSEESVLDLNFFGNPDPQRGIDVMRRKLQAEYIEKMKDAGVDGDQIIAQIRNSADLTKAQKLESEAVVRSHMSYDLPDGQFLDKVTMLDDGDPRSLEAIAATLRKHTSRLTVTNESINMDLPPSFIVREHASILGTINEAIKNNQNPIEAILQVGQSPAIQQYVGAFFQGVGNPKNYTQTSTTAYFMAERVNRMLTGMGVGLGAKDLGSAFDIWKGLGMKRVLPLFAGYEAYNQLNSGADDLGIPGLDEIGANVGARVHLAKAWLYGGVHASQVFPGSDKYFNNTSYEEEKERLRSGYEPIRANKFWLFGSRSEFAGGKIKYYLPDKFQRAHSDWETAENSTISGPGTQAHSWMPSVKYPLAPLAKILDPYWFERCLLPDVKLQTSDGKIVTADQIQIGMQLITHTGKIEPVTHVWPKNVDEVIYKIITYGTTYQELKVTHDHKVLAFKPDACMYRKARNGKCIPRKWARCNTCKSTNIKLPVPEWIPAEDINKGDYLVTPIPKMPDKITQVINVSDYVDCKIVKDKAYTNASQAQKGIPAIIELSDKFYKLLGYTIAEGCCSKGTVAWALNINEDVIAEEIQYLVSEVFGDYTKINRMPETGKQVVIWSNKIGSQLLRKLCYSEKEKILYNDLITNDSSNMHNLLLGIFNGDAYLGSIINELRLSLISESVIVSIYQILLSLGYTPTIVQHSMGGIDSRGWSLKSQYSVSLFGEDTNRFKKLMGLPIIKEASSPKRNCFVVDGYLYRRVKSVETEEYCGEVFDYTVGDDHSFCVIGYCIHNSFSEGPYAERPYVRSGPLFSPETPWGPALNSTIGAIVKPQVWLHPEYNPYTNSAEDIKANTYGQSGIRGIDDGGGDDPMEAALSSYDDEPRFVLNGGSIGSVKPAGGIQLMGAPQTSAGSSLSGGGGGGAGGGGFRSGRSYAKAVLSAVNAKLKAHNETVMPVRLQDQYEPNIMGYNEDPNDVQTIGNARYMERSLQDLHGIYGWGAALALNRDIPFGVRMADSSMAYGIGERFWDSNLGGLGGEANEVFRRFLPKRARTVQYYNPVPNQYFNSWLPGDNSFINIQRGDPQSVFENGQMRLPSETYEKLHGLKLMQTRASAIGGSIDEIVNGMLQAGEPMSRFGQNVTEAGDVIHGRIQDVWRKQGILKRSEVEIYNEELGISGHIDAYLNIRGQDVIGEIKSMSAKKFNSGNIFPEHLDQLNFYLATTGIRKGVLAYVNRDDLSQSRLINVTYDPIREKLVELKVARARQIVAGKVEDGEISRAQLYDPTTRFEILADISPYSTEFQALSKFLSGSDQLSKAQEERFQAAKLRARNVKKRYSLYGYHFTHGADVSTNENFTVKQIIDPNTIQTTSGETIKLAGIRASEGRAQEYLEDHPGGINFSPMGIYEAITNKEYGSAAEEIYARYGIRPGARINVEYSADPDDQNSQDMFRSLRGQVFVGSTSLNKALLANGIGEERETDWSAPGINVRFNEIERGIGSFYEHLAHTDSPFNTKLLRVRTPLEEYKRAQVYGTNSGDWAHPISTFIKPTVEAYASRHPIIAAASMGLFASMFGKTQSAKLMFASAGAVVGFGTSLSVKAQEFATGDSWIPDSVQKRRDIEEYYDKLKYVKFKRLYGYAVEQAMNEENTDVEEIISRNKEMGEIRKMAQQSMKKAKSGRRLAKAQADLINMRLKKITEFSGTLNLGPWVTQALLYRDQYESTFYGYEKGAPYKNVMRAIPKYEREIVAGIIKDSTPREKQEFFDLLPEYEKPALAGQLGIKYTGRKQVIDDYFMNHTLPELNWQGWNPQINLNDLKSRTARAEGVDSFAMGIYPQEIERAQADTREINVPTVHGSTFAAEDLLIELLQSKGINPRNVNVQVYPDSSLERNQIEVEGNVSHSRTGDIIKAIRGYM